MPIVTPPKLGSVYWTAYSPVDDDSSPVDPLRFETYAERLGNNLFPGITNRVERVRYFGMVCAGIDAASSEVGARVTGRDHTRLVRQRFVRFEAAWAYATVVAANGKIKERPEGAPRPRLRHEFRALRGANRVLGFYNRTDQGKKADGRGGYRLLQAQEAQGGLGAYLVALREHGFVHPDRLALTAAGSWLASAFYGQARRPARDALTRDGRHDEARWRLAGGRFGLSSASSDERQLVGAALFNTDRQLGRFVALLPPELRKPWRAEEAFAYVANGGSDLAAAASFAIAFDRLRRACLRLFAAPGEELSARTGAFKLVELLPDDTRVRLIADAQASAAQLQAEATPPGLEPIAVLAAELASSNEARVFDVLVDFHRREGRRWLEPAGGGRVQIGAAGTFQDPGDAFHGFTLAAALNVYEDYTPESLA